MDNVEIARHLIQLADLLEIRGANPFRVRAYRNAARTIEDQTTPMARMIEQGRELTELSGVGKEMASHIEELVATGKLARLEELSEEVPRTLLDVMRLPGVGPKRAGKLFEELGIATVDELEAAAKDDRVAALKGFGAKSQQKILAGIADFRQGAERYLLSQADRLVAPLIEALTALPEVEQLEVAGSYRRRRETVGDIDLLVASSEPGPVNEAFTGHPGADRVERSGDTRSTIFLTSGLQVDLRVVEPACFGAALVYFTGGKEHNVKLRQRALERGLKLSEYGVFRTAGEANGDEGGGDEANGDERNGDEANGDERNGDERNGDGEPIAAATEEEVYAALELAWVPPELREDRGEIAAAAARFAGTEDAGSNGAAGPRGRLPELIAIDDLAGDLHMHSTWSDGRNSIEEMAHACAERGYRYLAISDHSPALAMTNGLDARRLRLQAKEIAAAQRRLREEYPELTILRSQEVDILRDGGLDQDDDALAELDLVLISVHSHFDLPAAEQTERVLKAIRHPRVNVLCHPTGRILTRRQPIAIEMESVLAACAEEGVAVEINSHPKRLDLKDSHLMRARELGVGILINTDAHHLNHLDNMRYGVEQARRAWLTAGDVLNCRPLPELLAALDRPAAGDG